MYFSRDTSHQISPVPVPGNFFQNAKGPILKMAKKHLATGRSHFHPSGQGKWILPLDLDILKIQILLRFYKLVFLIPCWPPPRISSPWHQHYSWPVLPVKSIIYVATSCNNETPNWGNKLSANLSAFHIPVSFVLSGSIAKILDSGRFRSPRAMPAPLMAGRSAQAQAA